MIWPALHLWGAVPFLSMFNFYTNFIIGAYRWLYLSFWWSFRSYFGSWLFWWASCWWRHRNLIFCWVLLFPLSLSLPLCRRLRIRRGIDAFWTCLQASACSPTCLCHILCKCHYNRWVILALRGLLGEWQILVFRISLLQMMPDGFSIFIRFSFEFSGCLTISIFCPG